MESPFSLSGPIQAEFIVYRTASFAHAENIALALSIYAEILQMFPGAVAIRSITGPHEVHVCYRTDVSGARMLESLVSLGEALEKVIPKPLENQPVTADRADIVGQLHARLFSGIRPPIPQAPARACI